ncbi:Chitin bind 4 domain containing protein [Babesia ovata]|uniref:Chitin bind 4 domain containing protein n=1 Tax=Babesia ovata TaxID=189622 RepID=A0A2H6KFX0_9APIC|nr:Chitin bind 4 domain containing protein [Babesia ovata]GBE61892.1 Chitin bind 4 domain containing protein [Babesia ovata]
MTKHGVPLNTLKDCLQFLEWLKNNDGKQGEVANNLCERIKHYYQKEANTLAVDVKEGLSPFLNKVSTFYNKLATNAVAGNHDGKGATEVTDALLECIPKFLAAIYFLQYCINITFSELGGGGWKYDYPGYDEGWTYVWWRAKSVSGGDLAKYLYAKTDDAKYGKIPGLIPGGFSKNEVKYKQFAGYYAYSQGTEMYLDLEAIVKKNPYNFFRSVFVSSAIGNSAHRNESTANALSLVRTFCDIVEKETDKEKGGTLLTKLEEGLRKLGIQNSICWQDLKEHCAKLMEKLRTLFNTPKRFDFTGQATGLKELKTEDLAGKAADWLRENLTKVRGKLDQIDTSDPVISKPDKKDLGAYFTKNFFPYGFTFDGKYRYIKSQRDLKDLMRDWSSVIGDLKQRTGSDLEKLKEILEGKIRTSCPDTPKEVVPPKKPEVPPAKNHEGNQNQGKKGEGAQDQGKKAEGAQNQGKKAEGAQNQGKKVDAIPPTPQVTGSAPPPSSGAPGDAGPKGAPGPQGPPGPGGPGSTSQTVPGHSQPTITPVQQPQPPPPPPAPSPAAAPGHPGQPGGAVPSSTSVDTPGSQPGSPQVTVLNQTTGVSGSGTGPSGGQDVGGMAGPPSGQVVSQGTDHSSSSVTTVSGAPAAGGGGSGDRGGGGLGSSGTTKDRSFPAAPPAKPTTICDANYLLNLDAGKNPFCVVKPQKSKPDPIRFSRSDEQLASEHSPLPTAIRPGHRRPYFVPQERDARQVERDASIETFADGREVEEKDAYPMIMNDAYSGAISLDGNAKFDNANDYRQLLDEQKRQEAHNQLEQHYAEQHKRTKQDDERRWKDAYVDFVSSVSGDPIDYTYQAGALEGNVMPEFSGLIPQPDTLHDQILADYDNRMAQRNQKLKELTAANEHENRIITAMQDDHKRIVSDALAAAAESKVKEEEYYEAFSNPLMGTPVSDQSLMSLKSGNYGVQPPMGDFTGMPILDPELASSSMPKVELEPALPTPPIDIEVRNFNSQDNVLKSEITRTRPPPIIHPIDPASPYDTYPGLPPVSPPPDPNSDTEADYNHPSNWGKFKNHGLYMFPNPDMCNDPWNYVPDSSTTTITPTPSPPPGSDHLPQPNTVREMLCWLVGLNKNGYIPFIEEHLKNLLRERDNDVSQSPDALEVTGMPSQLTASHVSNTLTEACHYAANVLHKMKYKDSKDAPTTLNFKSVYCHLRYSDDPARLLCQLRDYAYACCHQLAFLKSQCSRNKINGGWQDCEYGNNIPDSPLQAFLIDAHDSKFKTHPFDPCDICLKSRVRMGFREEDLPATHETGKRISTILSPTCGGADPLLTLSSYLSCLTRRTPRTTGELVSFFHNFGNALQQSSTQLSKLGSALTTRHDDCPRWDRLAADDLQVIKYARGSDPPNSNHDKVHAKTLSTLLGCGIDNADCQQLMKPITYRAYALYSSSFVHDYLSWTVYLPDRLWESLLKLHCDLEELQCHDSRAKPLHQCDKAMPLLYSHGFTPPDGALQPSLTCSKVIAKLEAVVNGQPIASLMTAMDLFLYHIRAPFLFTITALWLTATLYIAHSLLYRMDVLRIRSHLLTTRASNLIDVKALLAGSRRMLSLYKDVDYFEDDFHS